MTGFAVPWSLPLLEAQTQLIAAGHRRLCVVSQSGEPPTDIRITQGPQILASGILFAGISWCSDELNLSPGQYQISLNNSGYPVRRVFIAVPPADVPKMTAPADNLSANLRTTVSAAWLASQDGGRWAWESWMRVQPLVSSYAPASVLSTALAEGKRLDPPRTGP